MIETKNISFRYLSKNILTDFSLKIKEGSFTALLGPNGAGKSTLLRLFCGILKPDQGNIFLDQKNIDEISKKMLAQKIAFMPSEIVCSSNFTVAEIVYMGMSPHLNWNQSLSLQDIAFAEYCMQECDVLQWSNRLVNTLSSGQKQLVFLAQCLAQKTSILLLDEPTAHLDIGHQIQFCKLLQKWNKKKGLTIATVFHDLNLAAQFCSHAVLLQEGKVLIDGTIKDVFESQKLSEAYQVKIKIEKNNDKFQLRFE